MPYVGNKPEVGNFRKCDAITTSATATYNLLVGGVAVNPNQNQCIVSLNGVVQSSGNSYTIASSQITFASALTSSDVIDFILILGDTLDVGVPSDNTVDASKITANIITGQSALGTTPADTDELLISDAGTLKRVDYSHLKSTVVNRPNANPIIINGNMNVWQRGTSAITMSDGYYNVDRFRGENNVASSAATWTQSTSVPDDTGLPFSLKVDCTTADTSIASGEQCGIQHTIEAQNIAGLVKYGTSDAEKITIAFWCKSNQTGQHSVSLRKLDNTNYCQPKTYTISSADTWEKKVLTFSALTSTGGAINQDNGDGLQIHWKLSAGSSYQGTADTWTQTNQGATAVSGDVNFLSSTSNDFYLTGIQLEVGEYSATNIPPYQHETYGDNLLRCQRYYHQVCKNQGVADEGNYGMGITNNDDEGCHILMPFPTTMRTSPSSITQTGSAGDYGVRTTSTDTSTGVPVFANADRNSIQIKFVNSGHGFGTGKACRGITITTNSFIGVEAEL